MKMDTTTAARANSYRLQRITTPEDLEMKMMHNGGATLTFGDRILVAGYYYNPSGRSYYGAAYCFTTADHTCEGRVELVSISEATFEDNGHAIAWAIAEGAATKYEIKTSRPDPFDLACGDCEVHYIECWEDITIEELRQLHEEQVAEDENTPDWAIDEMKAHGDWNPTILDFDTWLRQAIKDGYIRTAA